MRMCVLGAPGSLNLGARISFLSDSPGAPNRNLIVSHDRGYGVVMSVTSTGIDLIECSRIRDLHARHGDRLMARLLTDDERAYVERYKDLVPRLAGRFAAKEAILKVLGTGWRGAIAWRDMEILNDPSGRPFVTLTGECQRVAAKLGITTIHISITHTENYGAATAIGVTD